MMRVEETPARLSSFMALRWLGPPAPHPDCRRRSPRRGPLLPALPSGRRAAVRLPALV